MSEILYVVFAFLLVWGCFSHSQKKSLEKQLQNFEKQLQNFKEKERKEEWSVKAAPETSIGDVNRFLFVNYGWPGIDQVSNKLKECSRGMLKDGKHSYTQLLSVPLGSYMENLADEVVYYRTGSSVYEIPYPENKVKEISFTKEKLDFAAELFAQNKENYYSDDADTFYEQSGASEFFDVEEWEMVFEIFMGDYDELKSIGKSAWCVYPDFYETKDAAVLEYCNSAVKKGEFKTWMVV